MENKELPVTAETSLKSDKPISRRQYLSSDIDLHHADIPLCLCSFVAGLCDSVVFNATSVFASMQTGNTIFLGLGAAALPVSPIPNHLWPRALCSIGAFQLGVFCFSQTRRFHPLSRGTLGAGFLAQAALICVAAILAEAGVAPEFKSVGAVAQTGEGAHDMNLLAPIALLAFQFGGQVVCGRQLGFNEVPTTVLTSVYCDLFNDPKLAAPWRENPKRNRRVASAVLMLLGAVVGAWLARSYAGMSAALWISAGVKLAIAIAWFSWKAR